MAQRSFYKFSLTLLWIALAGSAVAHEGAHEESDDEDVVDLPVRKKKTSRKAPAPKREVASVVQSRPRFAFGLYLTQDFSLLSDSLPSGSTQKAASQSSTNEDGHAHRHALSFQPLHGGEDHSVPLTGDVPSGANSSAFSPVLNVKGGYELVGNLAAVLNVGVEFTNGVRDPSLGLFYQFPIADRLAAIVGVQASVPLSKTSQTNDKITTLTGSVTTLYQANRFFAGVGGSIAGSFYRQTAGTSTSHEHSATGVVRPAVAASTASPTAAQAAATQAVDLFSSNGSFFLGVVLTNEISLSTNAGLTGIYREDKTFNYVTDATLARLAYSSSGFMGSVAFSFLSDPKYRDAIYLPDQPYLGLKIQYVFGRPSTLGVIGVDSIGSR